MTTYTEPAFPRPSSNPMDLTPAQEGMTLRDYFAAKALQGMMGNADLNFVSCLLGEPDTLETISRTAYALSDAMSAQREKTSEDTEA